MRMIWGRLSEGALSMKTMLEKLIVHRSKTKARFHFQWLVFQRVSQASENDTAMTMNLTRIRLRDKTTSWLRMRLLNVLKLLSCTRDSLTESSKNSFKTNNKKVLWFSTRKRIAVWHVLPQSIAGPKSSSLAISTRVWLTRSLEKSQEARLKQFRGTLVAVARWMSKSYRTARRWLTSETWRRQIRTQTMLKMRWTWGKLTKP